MADADAEVKRLLASTKNGRRKLKMEQAAAKRLESQETNTDTKSTKDVKRKLASSLPSNLENGSVEVARPAKRQRRRGHSTTVTSTEEAHGTSEFRNLHRITVSSSCALPTESFEDATPLLTSSLIKALLAQGYAVPAPIQAQAWPILATGRDLIGVAKTGSGKTCAFLLPALVRVIHHGPAGKPKWLSEYVSEPACPSALVLAPTRELVQQIALEAQKFAPVARARIVAIFGGVPKGDQFRSLREGADIVVATTGRLLDFCKGNEKLNRYAPLTLKSVGYLVLDEADKMLDMGFGADVFNIASQCKSAGNRQTLFFTATWPKAAKEAAAHLTKVNAVHVRIGQDEDRLTANNSVSQVVLVIKEKDKLVQLQKVLKSELRPGSTAIVFVATRVGCKVVETHLKAALDDKLWCAVINKDQEQSVRDARLREFRELTTASDGSGGVLIATDVASRGLDIKGVSLVVIYDFSAEKGGKFAAANYVHRIGRTGRAGKTGRSVTLFTKQDSGAFELVELLRGASQEVPAALAELAHEALVEPTQSRDLGLKIKQGKVMVSRQDKKLSVKAKRRSERQEKR